MNFGQSSLPPASADILIRGADVVTMDAGMNVLRNGAIAVSGNAITWIGPDDLAGGIVAGEVIAAQGQIALPGLIDAHFHTGQQLLRGKIQQMARTRMIKLPIWKNYLIPWESCLEEDDVYLSGLVAYSNMIQGGTTCFAEAGGPHPDRMGQAALEVGIRGFISQSTVDKGAAIGADVPANMIATHDEALEKNVSLVKRWKDGDTVQAWMSLRQVIVCTPELIRDIAHEAEVQDVKIHTHLCEGSYEIDYTNEHFGMRPTEWLDSIGVLSHRLHAAHSVLLSDSEMDLYVRHRVSACHCSYGNYSIGQHRLPEMWRRGIDIGLGTDGPGGRGTIDMFGVIHSARVAQQAIHSAALHIREPISAEQLLQVATNGGARALGVADQIGSLEVGKKADIILCDTSALDFRPAEDPLFLAASVMCGRDVSTVLVNGRTVMRKREMVGVDLERVHALLAERMPVISARFEKLVG